MVERIFILPAIASYEGAFFFSELPRAPVKLVILILLWCNGLGVASNCSSLFLARRGVVRSIGVLLCGELPNAFSIYF